MKLKKLLCSILTLTMLLGSMSISVFAVENWDSNAIAICTADELKELATKVNGGQTFEGVTFTLANDINLGNEEWEPIGNKDDSKYFEGIFDGADFEISGLSITSSSTREDYVALFGATKNATIKNLTVSGSVSGANVAGIVARMDGGTVENCVSNVNLTCIDNKKAGGIVCLTGATTDTSVIKDCINNGSVTINGDGTNATAGGILAYISNGKGKVTISGCTNKGNVSGGAYAAGICGYCTGGNTTNYSVFEITECVNYGTITATSAGSIASFIGNPNGENTHIINNCTNYSETNTLIVSANNSNNPDYNADSSNVNVQLAEPVAKIGDTPYETLQKAIDAAEAGDEIIVTSAVSDAEISVNKNVAITGTVTLNNVSINAVEGCDTLTVNDLTFTGNSWINSGSADKLVVSDVTADVTPSNTAYTNSRSAFISLGKSEQKTLDLTVERCNIVSGGGSDPILGWAAITNADITGNTFGSESAYQTNSDSVKFMSIANGATLKFTDNTVYSNYNGVVLGQNTTRNNAYTATFDGNRFFGSADHVWIEVSYSDTCNGNVNVKSNNTVNGNAFTVGDIKFQSALEIFNGYMGVDVVTNDDGKVIGGTLAKYGVGVIADGYEVDENGSVVKSAPSDTENELSPITSTKYLNDTTIDLGGGTLVVKATIVANSGTVTIKNGTIDASQMEADLTKRSLFSSVGKLVLENVVINTSSTYKIKYLFAGYNTITVKNSTINAQNVEFIAYGDSDSGAVNLILDNTKLYMTSGCSRIAGTGGAISVTIQNGSLVDADNLNDRCFRNTEVIIDNSTVDVDVCEQFIKNDNGKKITLKNGAELTVDGCTATPAFVFASGSEMYATTDCKITVDGSAFTDYTKLETTSGKFNGSLINMENEDRTFISADLRDVYATKSIVLKIYDANDTLLSTTSLVDHGDILGIEFDSLSMMIGINCTDSYWDTKWDKLSADFIPSYGVLYIDDKEMNRESISMHTTSGEYSIEWKDVPGVTNYVAQVGGTMYENLTDALAAANEIATAENVVTVQLLAGELELGNVLFPATINNVVIKGADNKATILKNSSLRSAYGNSVDYQNITIDGIKFDNSYILFTGWRTNGVTYKDWTITNCEFYNITEEQAAVAFNLASAFAGDADEAMENFTFTNNAINGVTGEYKSGVVINAAEGDVLINNNVIKNVGWNAVQILNVPYYMGDNTDKSDKSTVKITNNVFENASADEGIINVYAPTGKGQVAKVYVNENKILAKNNTQPYICYAQDYKVDAKNNFWGIGTEGTAVIDLDYANKLIDVTGDKVGGSSGFNMPYYKTESMDELYWEAKIGDEYYATVTNALSVAKEGDTVVVLENATVNTSNAYRGDITLDLNEKTLTVTNDLSAYDETTLTIKNGTIDLGETGTISVGISDARFGYGVVTVSEDVVITGSGDVNVIVWNGTLNTAGVIENTGNGKAISGNGMWDTTEINITDGTVKAANDTAIYHPQAGNICVSGGSVEGDVAIVLKGGNLEISDGTLIADGEANEYSAVSSGYVLTGDALQIEHMDDSTDSDYYGTPTVSIKGGTFISENGNAVGSYANTDMEQIVDFISGGNFSNDVSDYVADGYELVANKDGTYRVERETTELFSITGTSTSLDSSLALNIYVASSNLTGENYYAVVEHEKATDVVETTIPYADWVTSGEYKVIRYTGIAAKEMTDKLTLIIYDSEGTRVSEPFETSLKAYALSTMSRFVTNNETNSLWLPALTDMLNYGAAAQNMFSYKTGNLASAGAEDFQQFASNDYTLTKDGCSLSSAVAGTTLSLEDMISLNVYFNAVSEGMYSTYSYTTHAGTVINETVDYDSFVSAWGYKGVAVPVAIADAETLITVTLFNSDNTEAGTAVFSVDAYLKDMIDSGKTDELYPALAKFVESAKTAFTD